MGSTAGFLAGERNLLPSLLLCGLHGLGDDDLAREGVNSFLLVAEANKSKQGFMCCPCLKCKNEKDYSCSRDIKSHLLRFGFMSSYNVWTKHGEEGVMMEDGDEEEDNDDQYRSMFSECDDTAMEDNEEEGGEEQASDDPVDDDLRRAISDARRDCGTDKERLQFDKMLEDHHKLLYPGCEDGHRKLGSILELLKWKAEPRYEKPSRAAAIAKPRSGGQESLFRTPPGRGSAPEGFSIDTIAIFTAIVSHDEEGVVLPRG
ncbi:hypothetical protein QYE76_063411 [Lolium multiflorum]|uniref:Transposase-associated domain-containing protein n=1 Tax=Lolium multiflorum TaxID=4521 RepID=A0AAD8S4H6_LOLMU|nr:hypothetical protein QYE76_063411 [Lolium multiflorum]